MSYQPRSTNPYIMEKKLNECVGGGGFDPSVLEEIEAEISVLGSENATMAQDIIDIKGSLNSINDNLTASNQTAGVTDVPFRFGCTDDGKFGYIINQGGADSVIPFKSGGELETIAEVNITRASGLTILTTQKAYKYILIFATVIRSNSTQNIDFTPSGNTIYSHTFNDGSGCNGLEKAVMFSNVTANTEIKCNALYTGYAYIFGLE